MKFAQLCAHDAKVRPNKSSAILDHTIRLMIVRYAEFVRESHALAQLLHSFADILRHLVRLDGVRKTEDLEAVDEEKHQLHHGTIHRTPEHDELGSVLHGYEYTGCARERAGRKRTEDVKVPCFTKCAWYLH